MKNKLKINKIEQINLELFGGCDLVCPMCPQSWGREKDFLKSLDFELIKSIIDQAIPLGLKYATLAGSGEPLLSKHLVKTVKYLSDNKVETLIYSNANRLTLELFEDLCVAGLTTLKISCQGWDRESYKEWMSHDAFDRIREILKDCNNLLTANKYKTLLQTNHLIHDYSNLEYQKKMYIDNWINYTGLTGEIWMDHNWSGQYDEENLKRDIIFEKRKKRSCGRPLANVVEIRAGGLGKNKGAVVPCPNVLGQDSRAVMGHLSDSKLIDIVNGKKMMHLRDVHLKETFEEIDYCKDCDQLIDAEETLVWTNISDRAYGESRVSGIEYVGAEKEFYPS